MARRRTLAFRLALVAAVALLVGGAVIAWRGHEQSDSPAGTVRGYFAALERSDAPAALGYGALPAGPHRLLTSAVLREQQRIAPMTGLAVTGRRTVGDRATVSVRYVLGFAGGPQPVRTTVSLGRRGGDWRLAATAVEADLQLPRAGQRASILGTAVPAVPELLFPGAVPIRFDTPYLQLDAAHGHVEFGSGAAPALDVDVTAAGTRAADVATRTALVACLTGRGPITCPQPSERYVPGSLRGTLPDANLGLRVAVTDSAAGVLEVSGSVTVRGHYQRLTFENRPVAGHGVQPVALRARGYAVAPLRLTWARP